MNRNKVEWYFERVSNQREREMEHFVIFLIFLHLFEFRLLLVIWFTVFLPDGTTAAIACNIHHMYIRLASTNRALLHPSALLNAIKVHIVPARCFVFRLLSLRFTLFFVLIFSFLYHYFQPAWSVIRDIINEMH